MIRRCARAVSVRRGSWDPRSTERVKRRGVTSVASLPLPDIQSDANLMEASFLMVNAKVRRLVVKEKQQLVGVIRELDLFFEIERLTR